MNEQIKELAVQAGLDAKEIRDDESLTLYAFEEFDIEKFAELVRQDERALVNPDLSIEANRVAYDVAMHYANKTKEMLG